jgi:hypothetical protein
MGNPTEISTPGTITMPPAQQRTGTPTSAWYWSRGQAWGPSCRTVTDWFNVNTGDYRFIIKRSTADSVYLPLTPDPTDTDEYLTNGNFIWSEATPPLKLTGVPITVRNDDASFARGGAPRNLCGGPNFLNSYKIVIYGQNMAFVPL